MEETKHTPENPAAFPRQASGSTWDIPTPGMSLRDYFAAKVMEGIVADRCHGRSPHISMDAETFVNWAQRSYAIADAMLLVREATAPTP